MKQIINNTIVLRNKDVPKNIYGRIVNPLTVKIIIEPVSSAGEIEVIEYSHIGRITAQTSIVAPSWSAVLKDFGPDPMYAELLELQKTHCFLYMYNEDYTRIEEIVAVPPHVSDQEKVSHVPNEAEGHNLRWTNPYVGTADTVLLQIAGDISDGFIPFSILYRHTYTTFLEEVGLNESYI